MIITVACVRPKSHIFPLFAWLIMLAQKMNPWARTSFSHMAVIFLDNRSDQKVLEANMSTGVQVSSYDSFFKKYTRVKSYVLEIDCEIDEFYQWVKLVDMKEYDFLSLFGLTLKALGLSNENSTGDNLKSLVCSELVAEMLHMFRGVELGDSDDWDILRTCKALEELKQSEC